MNFWPDDINAEEAVSPKDIMEIAGHELSSRTKSLIVSISHTSLPDRIVLGFIVKSLMHTMDLNLFEVSHRPDLSYPVVIDPPSSDIPEFLRRERRVPGTNFRMPANLGSILQGTPDQIVKNEWVCGTPTELRAKLKHLFAQDYVKVRVMSLLTRTTSNKTTESIAKSPVDYSVEENDNVVDEGEPQKESNL